MKVKQIIEKLTENWTAKVSSIVIALLIYIFYQLSVQDSKSFVIPLRIESNNAMAVAGPYPNRVKVTLRGKPDDIALLHDTDVSAYLDLTYVAKAGDYKLPVLVDLSEQALLFDLLEVKVSPQEIPIRIEEEISAFVPVSVLTRGETGDGYEIKSIRIVPEEFEISGPRPIVENYTRLQTEDVSVKGATRSFSRNVGIRNPGQSVKLVSENSVFVEIEIAAKKDTKLIPDVFVEYTGLSENFEISAFQETVSFYVTGNLNEIQSLNSENFKVTADCSSINDITEQSEFEIPLAITKPSFVDFYGDVPSSIKITVIEKTETENEQETDSESGINQNPMEENVTLEENSPSQ